MSRVIVLLACCSTLLALIASGSAFDSGKTGELLRTAALQAPSDAKPKTQNGKIIPPYYVAVHDGVPLVLYLTSAGLKTTDTVFPSDVTATLTGYTLLCTDSVPIADSNGSVLLRVTFSVKKNHEKAKAKTEKPKPKDDDNPKRIHGTGGLTITLKTNSGGTSTVPATVFGE